MNTRDWQITNVNMILHIRQTGGKLMQFKQRKDYGLIFVEQGSIRFDYGHETFLADSQQVMLIARDIDYAITFESSCSFYVVNFDMSCGALTSTFCVFNHPVRGKLVEFLRQLCIDWDFRRDDAQVSYISRIYQLLAMIELPCGSAMVSGSPSATITPSIAYLKEHYTDPDINNDVLAQVSNISTVYFRKLFVQQYGQPPMAYIRQRRIEHAKMLLRSEYFDSITDVAIQSGFKSLYHFSKAFRQMVGTSPSEYIAGRDAES